MSTVFSQQVGDSHAQKPKSFWRNDITGLRALAILPVVLYHAFPTIIPGGFIGVDIFFVISGFLISGILFREFEATQTVSLKHFYLKRIRRILPNLSLMLVCVLAVGYVFMTAAEYRLLGKEVYSSIGFYINFVLLHESGHYFATDAALNPLLHMWSLAIEEQFYIVFPLLFLIVYKCVKALWGRLLFIGAMTVASFVWMLMHDQNAAQTFYFPLGRFWEIGVGIFASYWVFLAPHPKRDCTHGVLSARGGDF